MKYDKTKDGWKLIENISFDGQSFIPDLVEFLKTGERSIKSTEIYWRAKELNANLGQEHAEYLEANQNILPVEWRGKYHLVFPGTIWLGTYYGRSGFPILYWSTDRWWLDFGWAWGDYADGALAQLDPNIGPRWNNEHRLIRMRR